MRLSWQRVRPQESCSIPTSTTSTGEAPSGRSSRSSDDGKPVYVVNNNPAAGTSPANQLRHVVPPTPVYNRTVIGSVDLTRNAQGLYGFDSTTTNGFFPLDNKGFVPTLEHPCDLQQSNFNFTTETRFWFEFAGREVRFLGRRRRLGLREDGTFGLAIDLGALHPRRAGRLYARIPPRESPTLPATCSTATSIPS